jgi:hypothetical protein
MIRLQSLSIFALAAALPLAVMAQSNSAQPDPVPAETKQQDDSYLRVVNDIDVVTADGLRIGEIEEVLIDTEGRPQAFVVEMGGFLGIGDREAAVPIDGFTYANGVYVSKMTETQLANLPEWDDRAD